MLIGIEAAHADKIQRTGVEEYCFQIIQSLKKQIPSSVRVILYSNESLRGELGVLPTNWQNKILKWPFKKGWSQIRLSFEFLFNPPDAFFAPGQLVPFFCPKNTIATVHDSAFLVYPSAYRFFSRMYLKFMNRLVVKKSKLIIVPSEFGKKELIKFYGIKDKRIFMILEGYDKNKYKKICDEAAMEKVLKKYGIAKPFIMSVGRLEEKKNTAGIIKAFNSIRSKGEDMQLLLAGKPGAGFEKIKTEIDNSLFKNDILTPGWVDADDLPCLFNKAEVFVFPSFYEGFGIPVLEAMACGCPVVASRGNSLSEVGGESVMYANSESSEEIAEETLELLKNKELRIKNANFGLERVKMFSWEKSGSAVADILLGWQKNCNLL
ncbi:MAG: glycosyltransferase family 1 protein [Patescibacteria group bacterium]|nr:glycosyltransferase family 1 protein [Patescibacteria group bacterium]